MRNVPTTGKIKIFTASLDFARDALSNRRRAEDTEGRNASGFHHRALCWLAISLACSAAAVIAQSVTVNAIGDLLHVRAPGFHFVKGAPLERLKDGRSVRFEFELSVAGDAGGSSVAETRHSFVLSYDLWEERFAVTHDATPSRSISHLVAADAERWCLDRITAPLTSLGSLGRDRPFWITLAYRVLDEGGSAGTSGEPGFGIRGLIDRLSRRRLESDLKDSIEAGPFRLK